MHKIVTIICTVNAIGGRVICGDDGKDTAMVIGCCRYSSDLVWKGLEIICHLQFKVIKRLLSSQN